MALKIITNNVPRDITYGYDLTNAERAEFDYYDADELESASFVRYRGIAYDLSEFMVWDNPASPTTPKDDPRLNWDGFRSDSFFSGIVVRYVDDFERVVCGLVLS